MASLRLLLALAALWFVTACELNRVLTVKPDGSGQISERMVAPRESFQKEKKPGDPENQMEIAIPRPSQENVAKEAAKLGEGIKVVSFEKLETKETLGYEAVYSFPDVTKIRADLFVQNEADAGPGDASAGPEKNFKFTKGANGAASELLMPIQAKKEGKDEKGPTQEFQDPKQRKAFFDAVKKLNLCMAIKVEGKIEETNAKFRDGNEITVSEMNIKGLSADPKYAQLFKDAEAGKTKMEEPPNDDRYIRHEEAETLKVRFK